MMLWSIHTENTRIISCEIIFDVLRPIWSRYFNVADTFRQLCGIYGINDHESRLEVTQGRWLPHQSKARTYDFLLRTCNGDEYQVKKFFIYAYLCISWRHIGGISAGAYAVYSSLNGVYIYLHRWKNKLFRKNEIIIL